MAMRRTCNPDKSVRFRHGAPPGKAQRGLSTRPIIERPLVRPQLPGPVFRCGQVNRCHAGLISHASGVQLASPQPIWGSRSTGGPLACTQQMRVRFPPLPPTSSSVTVAEWLRRQTVDLSTRVQFPPVTPVRTWGPLPLVAAQNRIFHFRGLGKRINPLGLGPRDSRFESEVPDQVLWGSQVARRLAVTQFMRRFESCPHSQQCRGRFLVESPCPTNRCSRVRSSTPVPPMLRAPVAEWI